MENIKNESAIEVWVGNLKEYTEGKLKGEWIGLPLAEDALRERLESIAAPGEERMIMDVSLREDCQWMHNQISEWSNVYDLNAIAVLVEDEMDETVEAYMESEKSLSLEELGNLLLQKNEIPYYEYSFDGSNSLELMSRLNKEEKMGYTVVESDESLKYTLENLAVGASNAMGYLNIEAIGADMATNGTVDLCENGYIDTKSVDINLKYYTMQEIREEAANRVGYAVQHDKEQEKQKNTVKKETSHTPDISPSM